MTGLTRRTKIGLLLALAVLAFILMLVFGNGGCTAGHAQVTFGTGREGTAAATAMAAGDPHPAAPGVTISSKSKRSVSRPARD